MSDTSVVDAGSTATSTPSPAPSSAPSGGSDSSSNAFSFLDAPSPSSPESTVSLPSQSQGAESPKPATPAPEPAPQQPPAPAPEPPPTQPAPTPAPQPQPQTPPTQPSDQQGTQTQQQPASQPKFDPADPISLALALSTPENFEAAIEHLATTALRLEPKELEGLETDVAGTVPRLIAKAVVFSQTQFLTMLSRTVPLMIQRQAEVTQKHDDNLGEFYNAWPSLDRGKHNKQVMELAVRYRQMFPQITKEQMIEQLGPMVLASLGLPIVPMHKKGAAAPAAKPNSQPPAVQKPPAGFVPAAPGTVSQVTLTPAESPFDYMGGQG